MQGEKTKQKPCPLENRHYFEGSQLLPLTLKTRENILKSLLHKINYVLLPDIKNMLKGLLKGNIPLKPKHVSSRPVVLILHENYVAVCQCCNIWLWFFHSII